MSTRKQLLMNAVLTGMGVLLKLQEGNDNEARELLVNLSSELSEADVDYLMVRFKELPAMPERRATSIFDIPRDLVQELLDVCMAQHNGLDILFARLIEKEPGFYPSKSGIPWDAIRKGNQTRAKLAARYELKPSEGSGACLGDEDYLEGPADIIAPITLERDRYEGHPESFSLPCELAETLGMVEKALRPKLKAGGKYQIRIVKEE